MSSRGAARARASLRDALAEVRSTHSSAELTAAVAKTLNKKERENLYARLRDEFSLPGTGSRDVAERVLEAVKQEAVEESRIRRAKEGSKARLLAEAAHAAASAKPKQVGRRLWKAVRAPLRPRQARPQPPPRMNNKSLFFGACNKQTM